MSWVTMWRGDLRGAVALARERVTLAMDLGVRLSIATSHGALGEMLDFADDLTEARAEHERAIEGLAGKPSTGSRAEARTRLVKTLVRLGDIPEARRQADLARAEVEDTDVYTVATSTAALAAVWAAEGNAEEAERRYRLALETIGRTGYVLQKMDISRDFGTFLIDQGRAAEARAVLQAVRTFYDTPVTPWPREQMESLLRRCAAVVR
jgi:tetratricopeptide (TPR) repeat protein